MLDDAGSDELLIAVDHLNAEEADESHEQQHMRDDSEQVVDGPHKRLADDYSDERGNADERREEKPARIVVLGDEE